MPKIKNRYPEEMRQSRKMAKIFKIKNRKLMTAGCWKLVAGYWSLPAGPWLQAVDIIYWPYALHLAPHIFVSNL